MADMKDLLKMLASPVLIAGAAGFGGRWANKKWSVGLNPWVAGVGSAAIGYLLGKGIQGMLEDKPAPAPAPEALPAAPQEAVQGLPGELEFNFNEARQLSAAHTPTPAEYNTQYVPASQTLAPRPDAGPPELDEMPEGVFTGAGFADFDDDEG